jgi:outer membrane protein assembly factor BamA
MLSLIGYLGARFAFCAAAASVVAMGAQQQIVRRATPILNEIRVLGLSRTSEGVVRQELRVGIGERLEPDALEESVQRLKNLLLFSRVEALVKPMADGRADLELHLEERWTLIPIARFGGGGGSTYFIVGAYDINVLGRYLEVGGQYENLVGAHSGVVWFRKPRLFGHPYKLGADVWKVNRPRLLYDESGALEGGFTLSRVKANGFAEHEAARWFHVGLGMELNSDTFGERGLPGAARELNAQSDGRWMPVASRAVMGRLWMRLGRIDHDVYLVRGASLLFTWEQASAVLGSHLSFYRATVEVLGAWRLGGTQNIAARLQAGAGNASVLQQLFYVGGLDGVRGFQDGELRGSRYGLANLEYRVSSYASDWVVFQHNLFADVAGVPGRSLVSSIGPGLRVLSPRIYRLTLRLDYAYTLRPRGRHGVSFGVQQLF